MADKPLTIIYLHGFNSSANAFKAQQLSEYIDSHHPHIHVLRPQIPSLPLDAQAFLTALIEPLLPNVALIGSSLGGYYAAYYAQRFNLRAVLINPAVYPYQRLHVYLGDNHNPYTGEDYQISLSQLEDFKALDVPSFSQTDSILQLLQTGDETLDYREALAKYPAIEADLEQGGHHQYENFASKLPKVLSFLTIGE